MTEIKGRTLILISIALAATIGIGGAWFRVSATNDCAKFWGPGGAHLITGESQVELLALQSTSETSEPSESLLEGLVVSQRYDLTGKPGMVHFRNALTLDRFFKWSEQQQVSLAPTLPQWRWALVFSQGDQRLIVLLDKDFKQWGRLDEENQEVLVTPAQYLDEMTAEYFEEIGIIDKPDGE